ncbi:VPLPA-CTERM sorting domain-containing protein [Meridianimarinicoccus aquatilis]|uniref:VPLPA-CTERM sorting domain-containing protein n=1 Tax=Meridianimarinicoccus aquatilis TaxID=2552766 RepID=A0A4R6AMB6_9RHOB|nr:VPLPA-CTERM sorting domain-containing protein [Fluviibacterium aquatile]TDL85150.1 VPLPA-CTERM sorting domain-containing protein [Fluviibacterium aquatile]
MRPILLLAPAVSLAALLSSTAAHAACVESPSGTYTCTGLQTGGLADNDDDVSVTIDLGAEVENNSGDALRVRGNDTVVENNGTLTADGDGVDSGDNGSGLTVTNNGTINANARGVNADDEDDVTVINTGLINAPSNDGIRLGNGANATFLNSGTLISGDEGMEAGDNATVTNDIGASITAVEDAIQIGEAASITNSGTIQSTGTDGDGVDMDSGTVVNTATGSISTAASSSAGIDFDASSVLVSTIINSGTIAGGIGIQVELGGADPANVQTQIVRTDGVIIGSGGIAMDLGASDDQVAIFDDLTFQSTADYNLGSGAPVQIVGKTNLGTGEDTLAFLNTADGGMIYDAVLNDLFDGGADTDTVIFSASKSDLTASTLIADILSLTFEDSGMAQVLNFKDFEFFTFGADRLTGLGGTTYAAAELTAPVPLPAGFVLLGGGLAALGAARARRKG